MREIDMTPYEEHFSALEKLYFERNAHMNIVAFMSDRNSFTQEQYDRVFTDYLNILKKYETQIQLFEENVIIPVCGDVNWHADFRKRVIYLD